MLICAPGEIAIVPFPFTDMALSKPRPALTLSVARENESSGATIFAMITTAANSHWPADVALNDPGAAGLRVPSIVRLKLFTLDNRLIARKLGTLSARDRRAVSKMLGTTLGI